MAASTQKVQRFNTPAMVEQFRYWAPTINDVARVTEIEESEGWRFFIVPEVTGACPIEVLLRLDGFFDLALGDDAYSGLTIEGRDRLIGLLDAVAQGKIVKRHWLSTVTGAPHGVETIVSPARGEVWRAGPEIANPDRLVCDERHFLPYRRG